MVTVSGLAIYPRIVHTDITLTPAVGILAKDIDKLGLDIRSFRVPLTRAVKQVIIPSIRKNFDVEGRPRWAALSSATVELRGENHPILRRSGALRRGATQFNIWTIGRTSAIVQHLPDRVWYGYLHQAGYGQATAAQLTGEITGEEAPIRIPQRQFIMLQREDADAIHAIFHEWLGERMAGVVHKR